jgi:hypothetical protein
MTHGLRLAGSVATTLELEGPATIDPFADVAKTVAAGLDVAEVVPGIAEVAATGILPLLTGDATGSAPATIDRLESMSRLSRCNSARISEECW